MVVVALVAVLSATSCSHTDAEDWELKHCPPIASGWIARVCEREMNRLRASCVLAFLALVARSNGSAVNATRPGSAEAAAAAEGRLVFIGNSSYVSRVVMASTCVVESTPCVASCTGIEEDVPLPLARPVYI